MILDLNSVSKGIAYTRDPPHDSDKELQSGRRFRMSALYSRLENQAKKERLVF